MFPLAAHYEKTSNNRKTESETTKKKEREDGIFVCTFMARTSQMLAPLSLLFFSLQRCCLPLLVSFFFSYVRHARKPSNMRITCDRVPATRAAH